MDVIKGTGRYWADDRVYLECACDMPEHLLRLSVWKSYKTDDTEERHPELLIEHYLQPTFSWYKRLWIGIKYVFRFGRQKDQFVDTVLLYEQVKQLQEFFTKNFS